MTATAERMKAMRDRRRASGAREVRLTLPDTRLQSVQRRVETEVAGLRWGDEDAALNWIEAVSDFDAPHETR